MNVVIIYLNINWLAYYDVPRNRFVASLSLWHIVFVVTERFLLIYCTMRRKYILHLAYSEWLTPPSKNGIHRHYSQIKTQHGCMQIGIPFYDYSA